MNFVFAREKVNLPKYTTGTKPYVVDVNRLFMKIKPSGSEETINTSIYLMNMILQEEFGFAAKKRKTCIYYINPSLNLDTVKNIKVVLPNLGIEVKKYYLVDDDSLKKIHKHVDQVIKSR